MIKPHGGKLVQRQGKYLPAGKYPELSINQETYADMENIATGVFSPLEGFIKQEDYKSVLEKGTLSSGLAWTIPILFHIKPEDKKKLKIGDLAKLIYKDEPVAGIEVKEIFRIDRRKHCKKIFGTDDKKHPGVERFYSLSPVVISGKITLLKKPQYDFNNFHLEPKETRKTFENLGWRKIVAFQTRNVPHLGHEYLQKAALTLVDGLFINPLMGKKKKGDFKDEVILKSYKVLIDHYFPRERVVLSALTTEMRYAGPREAIFHAIIRKNFGCTHIIIGRDHAGVGNFYHPLAAQKIFDQFPDLEIEPIFFGNFFHCKTCGEIVNDKICPHRDTQKINFSGTIIREMIEQGRKPPPEIIRPMVADAILSFKEPLIL